MNKHIKIITARAIPLLIAALILVPRAAAVEYVDGAPQSSFGKSTSVAPITDNGNDNIDRGKNSAVAPPSFASAAFDYPVVYEPITPGLYTSATAGDATVIIEPGPALELVLPESSAGTFPATKFTAVADVIRANGTLGTIKIPAISLTATVRDGATDANLLVGAGLISGASAWDGNVAIAAHNRGVAINFGKIHTLVRGNEITYTTKLGTRTYAVTSVTKISVTDWTKLAATSDNRLTLITCVADTPELRWCVVAIEVT